MRTALTLTVLSALAIVASAYIALQPVTDPGYAYPVALTLTGVVMAVLFTAMTIGLAYATREEWRLDREAVAAREAYVTAQREADPLHW